MVESGVWRICYVMSMMSAECGCYRKRCHDDADVVAVGAEGGTVDFVRNRLRRINVDFLMHAQHQHAVITTVPRISAPASVKRFKFQRTSQRSRL